MITSNMVEMNHEIQLNFKVTDNEDEYKPVLTGLAIVEASRSKEVKMKANSQVLVGQVTREVLSKVGKLIKYLPIMYNKGAFTFNISRSSVSLGLTARNLIN